MEILWSCRWNPGPHCQARPEDSVHRCHQHPGQLPGCWLDDVCGESQHHHQWGEGKVCFCLLSVPLIRDDSWRGKELRSHLNQIRVNWDCVVVSNALWDLLDFGLHRERLWCVASGQSEDFGQTVRGDQRTSHEAAQLPERQSKCVSCHLHHRPVALAWRVKLKYSVGNFFTDYWRFPHQHRDLCRGVWLHAEEGRQEKGEVMKMLSSNF